MRQSAEIGRLFAQNWSTLTLLCRMQGLNPSLNVRPEALNTVRRAKAAGAGVGILSNELELFYGRETIENLHILKVSDCLIDATHAHILKPDLRAYGLGVQATGLPAPEIVFVDDQARNVKDARKAALATVYFDVTRPGESFAEAARLLGASA
ncbi:MAG TPA: HAD-IA family hydrolase [Roseiarcus sp.]|nr:HAD-IA family hydrolase [Roseiarcus sp.]